MKPSAAETWRQGLNVTSDELLKELEAQRLLMIAVSTGREAIETVTDEYFERHERLRRELKSLGHACREALSDVAQSIYDPAKPPTTDGVTPSATDAKRRLEAYLAMELAGGSNEAARRHARAALDFANELQHRRTATFRDAALCAEATASVINLVAIISGRRDPRIGEVPTRS